MNSDRAPGEGAAVETLPTGTRTAPGPDLAPVLPFANPHAGFRRRWPVPRRGEMLVVPLGGLGRIGMNWTLYGADGGWLLVEHGFDQATSVRALMAEQGLTDPRSFVDLDGHPRVSMARAGP